MHEKENNRTNNLARGAVVAAAVGIAAVPNAAEISFASEMNAKSKKEATADASPKVASRVGASALVDLQTARKEKSKRRHKSRFTNYAVKGHTSTFGWPDDRYSKSTADQHTTPSGDPTKRPCIAIRNDSTLDHKFRVTVLVNHVRHQANMIQCDWGPAVWTGRNIDITGEGVQLLHLNPHAYPTGAWGIARELAPNKPKPKLRGVKRKVSFLYR